MLQKNSALAQALGAGSFDEILADGVQSRCPHVAAPNRDVDERQHYAWQDQMVQIIQNGAIADTVHVPSRHPTQLQGEDVDPDKSEPEGRNR